MFRTFFHGVTLSQDSEWGNPFRKSCVAISGSPSALFTAFLISTKSTTEKPPQNNKDIGKDTNNEHFYAFETKLFKHRYKHIKFLKFRLQSMSGRDTIQLAVIHLAKGIYMMKLNPFGNAVAESDGSIATQQKRRPGRPSLPPEERARRRQEQKLVYKRKDEARRRALNILQKRHIDEYKSLVEEQLRQNSI